MSERVGLVLEGGGMRGMYTAGVLDALLDKEIRFAGIVGVSAGALFGVNYLSKQKGRVITYNKRYNGDKNYMGVLPLIKEGNIVSTEYAYVRVPRELVPFDNETYVEAAKQVPFYAVATNVETGMPEYIKIDDVFDQMDVLRASGSLPMVSKPVPIDDKLYLDGGISDSIPYRWMLKQGYDKLVVILTRDINYRKKPFSKLLAGTLLRKYPKIAARMLKRHEKYNKSVEELIKLEKKGKVIVVRPSQAIKVSKLEKNPEKLQEVYDLGVSDCEKYFGNGGINL